MKPWFWIRILALAGGDIGYGLTYKEGWLGTIIGAVIGILMGLVLYYFYMRRAK
jgi:hypothetical protein